MPLHFLTVCCCPGFMPLHCIVANGLLAMYEYVTAELPHELRADESHVTKIGTVMQAGGLSSLQLAANQTEGFPAGGPPGPHQ